MPSWLRLCLPHPTWLRCTRRRQRRILAISFKRDAATLGARVARKCPDHQAKRFVSITFDGFAKGLVDQFRESLPPARRAPADYTVVFPRDDDHRSFLWRNRVNDLNARRFADLVAETTLSEDGTVGGERADALRAY